MLLSNDSARQAQENVWRAALRRGMEFARFSPDLDGLKKDETTDVFYHHGTDGKMIVVISGVHGIEGIPGSLVQQSLFRGWGWPEELSVAVVHAFNSSAFYNMRRTDKNNIDLNRHFSETLDHNPDYAGIRHLVEPEMLTEDSLNIFRNLPKSEMGAFLATVKGQCEFPEGLFYGGKERGPSYEMLKNICSFLHLQEYKEVVVIDLHTGLGPYKVATLLSPLLSKTSEDAVRTKSWYGDGVNFINVKDNGVVSSVQGDVAPALQRLLPGVKFTGIALEMGTNTIAESFPALIAENWLYNHPELVNKVNPALVTREMEMFLKSFAPVEDKEWLKALKMAACKLWCQSIIGLGYELY
ncbi:MAG TPA: DUF2817 domain-containing protein [Candidatus Paceibacterota bacterium]|nr:DUF2817 domain-containing protein [Candidatus Paceibacterota bacterium]